MDNEIDIIDIPQEDAKHFIKGVKTYPPKEIYSFFGIPPSMVGNECLSSLTNAKVMMMMFEGPVDISRKK